MKKNYIIPFGERLTQIGKYAFSKTVMCVDNIGLVVKHEKDHVPTDQEVRQHLVGWNEQHTIIIQADSLQDALKEFMDYPECKTGIKHKAWEMIDSEKRPVIEYSGCQWMLHKGFVSCQRYAEDGQMDNMVCVLDGLDEPPCDCPIQKQMDKIGLREDVSQIGGVWVKTFTPFVKPMDYRVNQLRPIRAEK